MCRALPLVFAAMSYAGSITGVIVDPVGAVISRAKIVAISGMLARRLCQKPMASSF
jgi:hypothetical protein